ncbi:MAG: hypothetical protein EHM20_11665, partial [Alphaproteobacteria bacterium]
MNTKQKMLLLPALILLIVGVITVSAAAAPVISSISPTYGPYDEGIPVTISGNGFNGATAVAFNGFFVPFTVVSNGKITVNYQNIVPKPIGAVQVSVLKGSWSNLKEFTYVGTPSINGVDSNNGPISGGNKVTITGASFLGTTTVKFGKKVATSFTVDSDNQITATVPAGANLGWTDVTVTNSIRRPDGSKIVRTGNLPHAYEYYQGPVIYSVVPNQGPAAGQNEVVINGAGFDAVRQTGVNPDG